MRWGYVLLVAPVLALLIMGLYVLQKCGVYKIEGDPDPMGLSDEGMWVDDVDLDEYGRVTSSPPSNS